MPMTSNVLGKTKCGVGRGGEKGLNLTGNSRTFAKHFVPKSSLFLAVLGLHCCTAGLVSSPAEWGCALAVVQASRCAGFSCCRAWALGHEVSVAVVPRL